MATKIEFAVNMTCDSCVSKIRNALGSVDGINNVDINIEQKTVVVETTLPSSIVMSQIEATGLRAVLKGYGSQLDLSRQHAAVAMLGGDTGYSYGSAKGVIRLVQLDNERCLIDGTIDGLPPGKHGLHIHECGDISQGCQSTGEHFSLFNTRHGGPEDDPQNRHTGDLGNIEADESGRAVFRLVDKVLKVWDVVGRAVVVTYKTCMLQHTGDLGNIEADESGRAVFRLVDKVLKVWDVVGRAMVVTQEPDDLGRGGNPHSLKDGNSGEKISCGIISRSAGVFENQKQICACDGVTIWDERDRPVVGSSRRLTQSSLCAYI